MWYILLEKLLFTPKRCSKEVIVAKRLDRQLLGELVHQRVLLLFRDVKTCYVVANNMTLFTRCLAFIRGRNLKCSGNLEFEVSFSIILRVFSEIKYRNQRLQVVNFFFLLSDNRHSHDLWVTTLQ